MCVNGPDQEHKDRRVIQNLLITYAALEGIQAAHREGMHSTRLEEILQGAKDILWETSEYLGKRLEIEEAGHVE